MITVNSYNDKRFTLNGTQYFRNYITKIAGSKLMIFNAYDNKDVLVQLSEYNQFTVNGSSYESVEELQSAIMGICYDRTTLGDSGVFNQDNVPRIISLGYMAENGLDAESLNYLPFTITETDSPVIFKGHTFDGKKYTYLFKKGKGIYGLGGTPFNQNDFELINVSGLTIGDIEDTSSTVIINLGELSDGDYLAAANSTQRDFTLSGQLDDDENIISYYFSYTQNDVLYFVQFVGSPSIYNGNLTESDLVSSTNSEAAPDITLQQITDNGNVTTNDIEVNGITVNDGTTSNVLLLSGTEAGNPITGDIEFENTVNGTKKIIAKYEESLVNLTKSIEFLDEDNLIIESKDNISNIYSRLILSPYVGSFDVKDPSDKITSISIYDNNIFISSQEISSRGLTAEQDFTANITALDYVQKKYIDDIPFIEFDETSPQAVNKIWVGSLAEYEALSSENLETLYLKEGVSETGWGKYTDSQYGLGSPFSITADTDTIVPNNSSSVNESQLPTDIATFTEVIDSATSGLTYEYSKILGSENDSLLISINLKAIPTGGSATYIELWFNDGSGEENKHIFTFPKGMGEVRHINFSISVIISNDWDTNGGTLYARSNGSCDIYDINWSVNRIHKSI